jgi:hypothetical protein
LTVPKKKKIKLNARSQVQAKEKKGPTGGMFTTLTGMIVSVMTLSGFSQKLCGVYLVRFKHPEFLSSPKSPPQLQQPGYHLYKFGMTKHLEQRFRQLSSTFPEAEPVLNYWTSIDPIYLPVAEKEIKSNLKPFRVIIRSHKEIVMIPDDTMPLVKTLYKHLACRYSSMEISDT